MVPWPSPLPAGRAPAAGGAPAPAARRFLRFWRLLRCATLPPLEGGSQLRGGGRGIRGVADGPHHDDPSCPCCHHLAHVTPVDAADGEPGALAAHALRGVAHVAEPGGRPALLGRRLVNGP